MLDRLIRWSLDNRVAVLFGGRSVEREVSRIRPAWRKGLVGMHTLNASGGLTTIDLRRVRRRF